MRISELIDWAREEKYDFSFYGDENEEIIGFSSLKNYKDDTVTWIKKPMSRIVMPNRIKVAVVQSGIKSDVKNALISDNSKELFFGILQHFWGKKHFGLSIGKGATIGDEVVLGENVVIGSNCVLEGKIKIGDGTCIEPNVTIINEVSIGEDCIVHSGTVVGKDGFGYSFDDNNIPIKVPHFGGVIIGDRVEIGANCTIDRGTIDDTIIGDDVKIDSLSLIAHNTCIGDGTMIVGGASLSGSSSVGKKSYIGPHCLIKNQIAIGNNTLISMGTIVSKPIGDDLVVFQNDLKAIRIDDYRIFL